MIANGRQRVSSKSSIKPKEMVNMHAEPVCLEKLNWLIHLRHIRGEISVCKELIKTELNRSDGKNEYAHFKQGIILRQEGKIQDALHCFQLCLKLNPENGENLKEIAKCLFEMGRFRLSLEAYLEAERTTANPEWQIYFYIGQCYAKLGDTSRAKEYAHKAVKSGRNELAYDFLVKILVSEGDCRSAVAVANAAVDACPDSVNMLTESGVLFLKMGQNQHAFERLSQALALDPTYYKALLALGCITQKHQEYDVALTKYKQAIVFEPDCTALWNNIGVCFHSKQKYIAAISCLKRALWLSPLNWRTLFNLGVVHLATKQPASAFNFACAAVNLRPDVAECFSLLASALYELNDSENALKAVQQAAVLSADDPAILINLALCCEVARFRGVETNCDVSDLMRRFEEVVESNGNVSQETSQLAVNLTAWLSDKQKSITEKQSTGDDDNVGHLEEDEV